MSVQSRAVTVTTTATLLSSTDDDGVAGQFMSLINDSAVTVYLGGADVDTTDGFPIAADGVYTDDRLSPGEAYYGIVASGTAVVHVLGRGV